MSLNLSGNNNQQESLSPVENAWPWIAYDGILKDGVAVEYIQSILLPKVESALSQSTESQVTEVNISEHKPINTGTEAVELVTRAKTYDNLDVTDAIEVIDIDEVRRRIAREAVSGLIL